MATDLVTALERLAKELQVEVHINNQENTNSLPVWNELLKSPSPVLKAPTPLALITPSSVTDVQRCVAFAVQHRIQVHAKGTGHHYAGACLADGGLLLDMCCLKHIQIDPIAQTAVVGAGVTSRELSEATIKHGLHFVVGHQSTVGCSGFTLGGGNGWGVTKYGAAADLVLGLQVVLPQPSHVNSDGKPVVPADDAGQTAICQGQSFGTDTAGGQTELAPLVSVDEQTNPELLAGMKGAGAFLGIVVELRLKLQPVPTRLPHICAVFPASFATQVADVFHDTINTAPCIEPSMAFVQSVEAPHEPLVLLGAMAFAPEDDPMVITAYDKVRALLPESRLHLRDEVLPYLDALCDLDGTWNYPNRCLYAHGMFVNNQDVTSELIEHLLSSTRSMSSPKSLILVVPGFPLSDKPSALDYRGTLYVSAYARWSRTGRGPKEDQDEAHATWVEGVRQAVGEKVIGCYMNENMLDSPEKIHACYKPETWARIARLKTVTDPCGVLRALPETLIN